MNNDFVWLVICYWWDLFSIYFYNFANASLFSILNYWWDLIICYSSKIIYVRVLFVHDYLALSHFLHGNCIFYKFFYLFVLEDNRLVAWETLWIPTYFYNKRNVLKIYFINLKLNFKCKMWPMKIFCIFPTNRNCHLRYCSIVKELFLCCISQQIDLTIVVQSWSCNFSFIEYALKEILSVILCIILLILIFFLRGNEYDDLVSKVSMLADTRYQLLWGKSNVLCILL
jgi:hypothetical protein